MKSIWPVADGGCAHFARLVYTVFHVWGNSPLSSLQVRGVSTIQGALLYANISNLIGTWVKTHHKKAVCSSAESIKTIPL